MTEREPNPIKTPAELQGELKQVYQLLPKVSEDMSGRKKSRFTQEMLSILDYLLGHANITQVFKDAIRDEFNEHFRDGIDRTAPNLIFDLVGASKDDAGFEGIFSNDFQDRMSIEEKFRDNLSFDLQNARWDFQKRESFPQLTTARIRLERFDDQFKKLYSPYEEASALGLQPE